MSAADSLMDAIFHAMNYSEQAKLAALAEETVPLAAGAGIIVAPFLTFYGVAAVFMALGSGYQAATEEVRNENSLAGFTHGYVMGLLGWSWHSAVNHFGRHFVVRISITDEGNDVVRVNAYNRGLRAGFFFATPLPESMRKTIVRSLLKVFNTRAGDWSESAKLTYVIELASALKRLNRL